MRIEIKGERCGNVPFIILQTFYRSIVKMYEKSVIIYSK